MFNQFLKFGSEEVENKKFHSSKKPINIRFGYGKNKITDVKFFTRYKNDEKTRPFCIKLPKMNGRYNSSKGNKNMFFEIKKMNCQINITKLEIDLDKKN